MSQSIEQRLSVLAIAYTQHRKAMNDNSRAIRTLHNDVESYIDLKPYRERYLSGEVTDDPECCIVWRGWLHAVEECQAWDDVSYEEDCAFRCMGRLLDERKSIKADGAKIRNSLRIIGDKLLRDAL